MSTVNRNNATTYPLSMHPHSSLLSSNIGPGARARDRRAGHAYLRTPNTHLDAVCVATFVIPRQSVHPPERTLHCPASHIPEESSRLMRQTSRTPASKRITTQPPIVISDLRRPTAHTTRQLAMTPSTTTAAARSFCWKPTSFSVPATNTTQRPAKCIQGA